MFTRTGISPVFFTVLVCASADAQSASAHGSSDWPPPQFEMHVPFEPTAFPSAGRTYLTYELHLRNFAATPVTLLRVEVLDPASPAPKPIAAFETDQLETVLQPIGAQMSERGPKRRELTAGGSAVVFVSLAFDRGAHVPNRLRHRVITANYAAEGAVIRTRGTELHVLGPPVKGGNWLADSGPSNDSHHRRGIFVFDGRALIGRRYAIDWMQTEKGAVFSGDKLDNRSHHAYGEEVYAVADGRVVAVKDGIPDNTLSPEGFRPAVPIALETLAGNSITLELGGGQFAFYAHLKTGSLRVKAGDRVQRGQALARIGNSGDSRKPHLHFQVTTSPKLLAGEGVPYLISRYRIKLPDDSWDERTRELPLKDMLIDFGR
jgi:hypothetical protein